MSPKKSDHIHKFNRKVYKTTGHKIFFCINNCPSNFKIDVALSLGKVSLCNICGTPFSMNEYSIRQAKPRCMNCVKRKGVNNVKFQPSSIDIPDRREELRRTEDREIREIAGSATITELNKAMDSLLITREYNPEDEEDIL